jgi:hypothetical protein
MISRPLERIAPILFALSMVLIASCGSDGNDGNDGNDACTNLCEEVKPKLIEQMPDISEPDVQCDQDPWASADTCNECKTIFNDLFDVSLTDPGELCARHFD